MFCSGRSQNSNLRIDPVAVFSIHEFKPMRVCVCVYRFRLGGVAEGNSMSFQNHLQPGHDHKKMGSRTQGQRPLVETGGYRCTT